MVSQGNAAASTSTARTATGDVMDGYERAMFWAMAVYIGIDACRNILERFL